MSKNDDEQVDKPEENTSLAVVTEELRSVKKVQKEDFEKYLNISMDQYDLAMSPQTATRYKRHIMSLKHGLHAGVPLTCYGGAKCPIGLRCPFTERKATGEPDWNASTYPLFRPCPVERDMVKLHMLDLIDEYNVHPEDATDMAIISRLAVLNVYEYRASVYLSRDEDSGGGLIIEEVGTVDPKSGREFMTKKIHPAFDLQEKVHRQRQELLRSMVATRREKYKAAAAAGDKSVQTNLGKSLQDIIQKINQAQEEQDILDADFEEASEASVTEEN
jgi:hypothetical protein